jgi:hypothetical protein
VGFPGWDGADTGPRTMRADFGERVEGRGAHTRGQADDDGRPGCTVRRAVVVSRTVQADDGAESW